jgi:hypothetical protein
MHKLLSSSTRRVYPWTAGPWRGAAAGLLMLICGACEPPPGTGGPVVGPAGSSVAVTGPASLGVDGSVQLSAAGYDAQNNLIPGLVFTWSSSNVSVATVDAQGLVRGVGAGSADIRATSNGSQGVLQVGVEVPRLHPMAANLSAKAGALYPQPLQASLVTPGGAVVAGATVRWVVPGGSGWVFPASSVTDAAGVAQTWWVAGSNASQTVMAIRGGDTARIGAQAQRTASNANSLHFDYYTPGRARADAFRIEIEPQTDPGATFYEAIGFDGGYAGLQAGGDLGGKQVIFSVWDVDSITAVAQLLDRAGSTCDRFFGEGTGIKCRFLYPWAVGRRYRFEVQAVPGTSTTDLTAYFTDVTAGTTIKIATLRRAKLFAMDHNDVFVEDFGAKAPSCLDTALRAVIVRNSEYRLAGAWQRFSSADLNSYYERTVCANFSATPEAGGIRLTTGGSVVGDVTAKAYPQP